MEEKKKVVERKKERNGEDIEKGERERKEKERKREKRKEVGKEIKVMYVKMDGKGVSMVRKEMEGRKGKGRKGREKKREVKIGSV